MYIQVITQNQIKVLADLAKDIWQSHFGAMIEPEILEYLINSLQSKQAILNQIQEGYLYYFIQDKGFQSGYFAYKLAEAKKELFLSKIYIIASQRGKGLGKQVIKYLEEVCKDNKLSKITLTVFSKNQSAIKAYERLGFNNLGLIERDFGNGIKFDDYKMEKYTTLELKPK